MIVRATANLMEQHAISSLAEGILTQLAVLLKLPLAGIVCTQKGAPFDDNGGRCYVVSAAGRLAPYIAQPLDTLPDRRIVSAVQAGMAQRQHVFGADYTVLYLKVAPHQEAAIFLDSGHELNKVDRSLIEVFTANIAACFRNVKLVEYLNHLAFHDPLTHLPNRLQFIADLDAAARADRQRGGTAGYRSLRRPQRWPWPRCRQPAADGGGRTTAGQAGTSLSSGLHWC